MKQKLLPFFIFFYTSEIFSQIEPRGNPNSFPRLSWSFEIGIFIIGFLLLWIVSYFVQQKEKEEKEEQLKFREEEELRKRNRDDYIKINLGYINFNKTLEKIEREKKEVIPPIPTGEFLIRDIVDCIEKNLREENFKKSSEKIVLEKKEVIPIPTEKITLYHKNRVVKEKGFSKNGEKEGVWKYFYKNGQLESTGTYSLGRKDGKWEYFYENGQLESVGVQGGSVRQGHWKHYYENGQLESTGMYTHNMKHLEWLGYHDNGVLKYKEYYNKRYKRECEYYYDNGQLESKGYHIMTNKKEGVWEYFFKNGLLKSKGNYRKGKKIGKWTTYQIEEDGFHDFYDNNFYSIDHPFDLIDNLPDGNHTSHYQNSDKIGSTFSSKNGKINGPYEGYFENGLLREKSFYIDDGKVGDSSEYYENGQLRLKTKFILTDDPYFDFCHIDGLLEVYYENGQLKYKTKIRNHQRTGVYESYTKFGMIINRVVFQNGNIIEGDYKNEYFD